MTPLMGCSDMCRLYDWRRARWHRQAFFASAVGCIYHARLPPNATHRSSMTTPIHPDDSAPVKSKVDRVAGYAALREMAALAQQVQREEEADRLFVKRAIQVIAALAAVLLIALMMPGVMAGLLRFIANQLR